MNKQELRQWREFCTGRGSHTPDDFSDLFMEVYLEPLTEQDKVDLKTIFGTVPNSTNALEKMLLLDEPAESKSNKKIEDLVLQDLKEMRRIGKLNGLFNSLDAARVEITLDEDRFQQACNSQLNQPISHELANYLVKELSHHDGKVKALSNAFYGIASKVHLQWALTADLLQLDVNFEHYFELYLIGVDYALEDEEIVIMNHRAKYAALS